jgi:molybdopterin converting factor small subunit
MAVIRLRAPLSELAGGKREVVFGGATVGEVLGRLEAEHPSIAGWILDERRRLRRHINVFVNGERGREETAVTDSDQIHVVASISGG